MADVEKILEDWRKDGIAYVRFELPDMYAYTRMRRYELSRFKDAVSDWERTEYLELF